ENPQIKSELIQLSEDAEICYASPSSTDSKASRSIRIIAIEPIRMKASSPSMSVNAGGVLTVVEQDRQQLRVKCRKVMCHPGYLGKTDNVAVGTKGAPSIPET